VTDWWVPRCSREHNIYNDPQTALGPPDAAGFGPESYSGFISLGFGGRVTVDLGGCLSDRPGADLRVFEAREPCGIRINAVRGYCDFDLATAGVTQARYVRVEDGELFPCPGGTRSEGADLDAVQALGVATGALDSRPRF
jgi:hypothetical protein